MDDFRRRLDRALVLVGIALFLFFLVFLVGCSSPVVRSFVFKDSGNYAYNDLYCYKLCLQREVNELNYSCRTVPTNCFNGNCTCITR